MSTGRDDPCHCGSKQKYRDCCETNDRILADIKILENIQNPTFPEKEIVQSLIAESQPFADFYKSEREKIIKPVLWVCNGGAWVPFRTKCTKTYAILEFRDFPVTAHNAFDVAHELFHSILDREGFPCLVRSHDLVDTVLVSGLSSMPLDLVIEQRCREFGFNVRNYYEGQIRYAYTEICTQRPNGPINGYEELCWIINYADLAICWELFCSSQEDTNAFQDRCDNLHPEIAARGQELLEILKDTGYENPSEVEAFFERAAVFLDMRSDVTIDYKG